MVMLLLVGCGATPVAAPETVCPVDLRASVGADVPVLDVGPDGDYSTIHQAVSAAVPGTTIRIAPGTYLETVHVQTEDVTLVGACTDGVVIDAVGAPGGLFIDADRVAVRGLTVTDTATYGALLDGDGTSLEAVRTADTRGWGVGVALGREATLIDVTIDGNRCLGVSNVCVGLNLAGSRVSARGLRITDASGIGISVSVAAEVYLEDLDIDGVYREGSGDNADGIHFEPAGGRVTIGPGSRIRDVERWGVWLDAGGALTTTGDVTIETVTCIGFLACGAVGAGSGATLDLGAGLAIHETDLGAIYAEGGASVAMHGVEIARTGILDDRVVAIYLGGSGNVVDIDGLTLSDVSSPGVFLNEANGSLRNITITGARGYGLFAEDSVLDLSEVEVSGVRDAGGGGLPGIGLVLLQSVIEVSGIHAVDNADYGIVALQSVVDGGGVEATGNGGAGLVGLSSVLTLDGVTVTGTVPAVERGWGGYGILLTDRDVNGEGYLFPGHEGASARLDGVTLAENAEAGLVVDAVSAELSDVTIGSTNAGLGEGGDGAVVLRGGVLDAADVVTTGNQRASLLFDGSSGSLQVASGDEPIGLVQQACDAVAPLGGSDWSFAAVHLCDGEVLPIAYTPLAWSNDVDVQP